MTKKSRYPRWRMTAQGHLFLLVIAVVLGSAYLLNHSLLFLIEALFIATFIYDALLLKLVLPKVQLDWEAPQQLFAGTPSPFRVTIRNPNRFFPIRHLQLQLGGKALSTEPHLISDLGPGQTLELTLSLVAAKRGRVTLDEFVITCSYPFGFWEKRQVQSLNWSLIVFPRLLSKIPDALAGSRQRQGTVPRNTEDFQYLEKYRDGDDVRLIHWRKSTLLEQPVVRKDLTQVDAARPKVLLPDACLHFELGLSALATMAFLSDHWNTWSIFTPKGLLAFPNPASFLKELATLQPLSFEELEKALASQDLNWVRLSDIAATADPHPVATKSA